MYKFKGIEEIKMKIIKRGELKKILDSNAKCTLVDVRSAERYHDDGYIPTAINVPLKNIETWAKQSLLRDERVVVYCGGFECTQSTQATEKLTKLGFRNIIDFEGGIKDWKDGTYHIEKLTHTRAVGE
jgi:rhodanese-related sulfurtransferase